MRCSIWQDKLSTHTTISVCHKTNACESSERLLITTLLLWAKFLRHALAKRRQNNCSHLNFVRRVKTCMQKLDGYQFTSNLQCHFGIFATPDHYSLIGWKWVLMQKNAIKTQNWHWGGLKTKTFRVQKTLTIFIKEVSLVLKDNKK